MLKDKGLSKHLEKMIENNEQLLTHLNLAMKNG
jgi:hypothetical protein